MASPCAYCPGDFPLGSFESRAAARGMLADRQAARQREAQGALVQDAVRDTYTWVTEHTRLSTSTG